MINELDSNEPLNGCLELILPKMSDDEVYQIAENFMDEFERNKYGIGYCESSLISPSGKNEYEKLRIEIIISPRQILDCLAYEKDLIKQGYNVRLKREFTPI